mmetsp:Transcript_7014/g.12900  ORF Transcript_7014/g.12900 Transcript_7014/m.12900 type:complete len:292 (+) Transcript_7014:1054-1929(+)
MSSLDLPAVLRGPKKAQAWNLILANLTELSVLEQYISMQDLVKFALKDLGDDALQMHILTLLLHLSSDPEMCEAMLNGAIVNRLQDVADANVSYVTMLLANLTRTERGVEECLQVKSAAFKYLLATKLADKFLTGDPELEFFANVLANISTTETGRTFIADLELAPKLISELGLEGVRNSGLIKSLRNLVMSGESAWHSSLVEKLCSLLSQAVSPTPVVRSSEELLNIEASAGGDDLCDTLVYLARSAVYLEQMRQHDLTTVILHKLQSLESPALEAWALLYQVLETAVIV